MSERSALPFSASAALAFAAIAGLAACAWDPGPAWLQAGTILEPELAIDEKLELRAHLESGWALHLAVDQRGLDVALKVATAKEVVASSDLPFGSFIREEVRFLATAPVDLAISLETIAGRGRPRLEVLYLGPASVLDTAAASDFAIFERSWELSAEPHLAALRRLNESSADQRLRILAGMRLGLAELGRDNEAAIYSFDRALELLREYPEAALQAHILAFRFRALLALGREPSAAIREASAVAVAAGDTTALALLEHILGRRAWEIGDHEAAIRHYTASRNHFDAAGYPQEARQQELTTARAQMRLGSSPEPLARMLRLWARLPLEARAPPADTPPPDTQRGELLREIGWWLFLEGRFVDAETLIDRAHRLAPQEVETLQRLASCQLKLGNNPGAAESLKKAQALKPTVEQSAYIESNICLNELDQGRLAAAREHCAVALDRLRLWNQRSAAAAVELILGQLEKGDGRLEAAEQRAAAASAAVERQRGLAAGDRERMDLLAVRTEPFELLTGLRLTLHARSPGAGWDKRALEAVEQLRARRLRDLLEAGNARRLPAQADRGRRKEELLSILATTGRGMVESLLLQQDFEPRQTEQLDAALRELDRLFAETPAPTSGDGARDLNPKVSAPVDLRAVLRSIETGTALLVYHLGDERAFGWVLTAGGVRGADLGSSGQIRKLAEGIRGQTIGASPFAERSLANWSGQLAELLYTPFSAELAAARQVVVVAPAELQQISFAALPFPASAGHPLIASRSLANLPSVAVLPALRRAKAMPRKTDRMLAIVDDPVYDNDPRLPSAARRPGRFRRLPDTADEAADLQNLWGEERSTRLTGFAANRERLLSGALQEFRILHFASHARTLDPPHGLVLSRFDEAGAKIDDRFGFPELVGLDLDAELAVISACSSALGAEVEGEGLLGLSQGFLSAGIPRLLLTLWPVKGEPARRVVALFYRHLLDGQAPAEALRRTQVELAKAGRPRKEWAAFALYGDWRPLSDSPR